MSTRALNAHTAHVLYAAFIGSDKRHDVASVARGIGIPASTLYGYCENHSPMPAYVLQRMAAVTRDAKLLSDLLGLGDAAMTLSVDPAAVTPDRVRDQALRLGEAAGRVQSAVRLALSDEIVTEAEMRVISESSEELQRQSETLRKAAEMTRLRVAK